MNLKTCENLNNKEKLEVFDKLLEFATYLQNQNVNLLVKRQQTLSQYKKDIDSKFETSVTKEVNKRMDKFKGRKLKEMSEEEWRKIYLETKKKVDQEKMSLFHEKWDIRNEIINEIAEANKKKYPILNLNSAQWKSREKLYPLIIENPAMPKTTLAQKANTSVKTAENAINELMATSQPLNNKIDLIKRIVTRSALTVEKWQEVLLKRLMEEPETIANKDLISAIKNWAALYSLMVWQATDSKWWIIKKEDQDMLDEVLWDNL